MIYYKGEILFDQSGEHEICEYYNVYLSIDTNARMKSELSCLDDATKKKSKVKVMSFADDVPSKITDRDFNGNNYTF